MKVEVEVVPKDEAESDDIRNEEVGNDNNLKEETKFNIDPRDIEQNQEVTNNDLS